MIPKKRMSNQAQRAKTPKQSRRRLHTNHLRNYTCTFLVRREVIDIDIFHDNIRTRAVVREPGMVDLGNVDVGVRGLLDLRVEEELCMRFSHCGVVVFDEKVAAIGRIFQAVVLGPFLAAELLDLVLCGEIWDVGIEDSVVCNYHGEWRCGDTR